MIDVGYAAATKTSVIEQYFVSALTFKKMFGASLLVQQLTALFTKRVIFTCRKWLTFLLQVRK
jgi:hypothetical protein